MKTLEENRIQEAIKHSIERNQMKKHIKHSIELGNKILRQRELWKDLDIEDLNDYSIYENIDLYWDKEE